MSDRLGKVISCLIAGCLGGVAANVLNLIFGYINIPMFLGVDISSDTTIGHIYLDLFFGGLWGLLFLIPILHDYLILKGIVLSVIPTLFQLLVILPLLQNVQPFAFEYGQLMPLYILLLNLAWGIAAGAFLSYISNSKKEFHSP